jgi:hypothetical protein
MSTKQKIPRTKKVRRIKTAERFRQLAAAPEPIISSDAEVMMIAVAPKAAPDASGAEESARVMHGDICRRMVPVFASVKRH